MMDISGNKRIEWIYSVSGAKLRKTVYTNGAVTLTQDYVSGYVYKNNQLDFFAMEQGRVKKLVSGSLRYEYDIKDHLGNTRVCFADTNSDGAAEILEESHYYAFGSRIEGLSTSSPNNKFTYNGKELEDDHGLNWYHYGARYYDPALGRWHAVDPVDEFTSSYNFVGNDPINFMDPNGMDSDPSKNQEAETGNKVEDGFFGAFIREAYAAIKASLVREEYEDGVAKLAKDDSEGRTALKQEARAKTPAEYDAIAENMRPIKDEAKRIAGTANKSNITVNTTMKIVGRAGKVVGAIGIVASIYNISTADNTGRAISEEIGAYAGAIVGGNIGAAGGQKIGLAIGGPKGAIIGAWVGGVSGGAAGGIIGGEAGEKVYNWINK